MDVTAITNHLAVQSDRWLFLFALVVLGIGAYLVIRYLVAEVQRLTSEHKEITAEYHVNMKDVMDQYDKTVRENTEVMARCRRQ